jgi:HlyD family secretion protein
MKNLLVVLTTLTLVHGYSEWCAYSADDAESGARTATVNNRSTGKKITAPGTVEPEELVIIEAQVTGTIASLGPDPRGAGKSIDFGSPVERGTVLAQIDNALYSIQVEQERASCAHAVAELAQAKINLEQARAVWQIAQEKHKGTAVSNSDYDSADFKQKAATVSVAAAEAVLAQKKAALKRAETELGYTTIQSPIKGVIIDRRVYVGQMIAPVAKQSGLFLVANLEKLQVWASVNEADIAQIRQRQQVRFTVNAYPGKVFEGEVEQVRLNATRTQNGVTYTVVVAVSGAREGLLPYMTANVEFQMGNQLTPP